MTGAAPGDPQAPLDDRRLSVLVSTALACALYSFGYDLWKLPPQVSGFGTFGRTLAGDVVPMIVAPLLVARFALGIPLASLGVRWPGLAAWLRFGGLAWLAVLPLVLWLSQRPELVAFYPSRQFPPAREHVIGLVFLWIFMHAPQLAAVECLFRGVLLQPLARRFGFAPATTLVLAPYVALHATKPGLELLLAVWGGFVFCAVAWRTRSVAPAFLAHWLTAVAMDALCFAQLR